MEIGALDDDNCTGIAYTDREQVILGFLNFDTNSSIWNNFYSLDYS